MLNRAILVEHMLVRSLDKIMRPLVRMLIRKGVTFPELTSVIKNQYVDLALSEFGIEGRSQSHSRIALLTGLSRHDVAKLASDDRLKVQSRSDQKKNRNMQLIFGWMHDENFVDKKGKPADLEYSSGKVSSFEQLVKKYGSDIPSRTWLDELTRLETVKIDDQGKIKLCSPGYVPPSGDNALIDQGFSTVADLLATIDHNDQHSSGESRLQLSVSYDNVSQEGTEAFRYLSREKSKSLLVYLDKFLRAHDQDASGAELQLIEDVNSNCRTGLSIFYFEGKAQGVGHDEGGGDSNV